MKHGIILFLLFCSMLLLIISGCGTNNSTPPSPIIDISFGEPWWGLGFGKGEDEIKRWQTFKANALPKVTKIEVKIYKGTWETNQSDVTVELYSVTNNLPSGAPLATTTISADSITEDSTIASAPLSYNGMVNGRQYAVVLGQVNPQADHYRWEVDNRIISYLNFGKYTGAGEWKEESYHGWLKVYVSE
jgi:hypothetical protein